MKQYPLNLDESHINYSKQKNLKNKSLWRLQFLKLSKLKLPLFKRQAKDFIIENRHLIWSRNNKSHVGKSKEFVSYMTNLLTTPQITAPAIKLKKIAGCDPTAQLISETKQRFDSWAVEKIRPVSMI